MLIYEKLSKGTTFLFAEILICSFSESQCFFSQCLALSFTRGETFMPMKLKNFYAES